MKPMKPRLNFWPWAVLLTLLLFFSGTVSLVVMACSQKVELVNQNYYAQGLKYERQIQRLRRTQRLAAPATLAYDLDRQSITFCLPPDQGHFPATGTIQLYRPSAAGQDRQIELRLDNRGSQTLDAASLSHGLWKVRVTWRVAGLEYYLDQRLVIGAKAN
jgi:hypothetical protein